MTFVSQNYNNLITNLINKNILEATSNIAQASDSTLDIPDELYILADEKWIATQSKEDGSGLSTYINPFLSSIKKLNK